MNIFYVYIQPIISYGIEIWWQNTSTNIPESLNRIKTKYMKAVLGIPLMANNNILHINTNKTQLAYIFQEEINEKIRKLRIPHLKNYIVPKPEDSLPFFMPIEELPSYL